MATLRAELRRFIVDGHSLDDIEEWCALEHPGLAWRTELALAIEELAESQRVGYCTDDWHRAARLSLYQSAIHVHDYPLALKILDSLMAYPPPPPQDEDEGGVIDMEARFEALER